MHLGLDCQVVDLGMDLVREGGVCICQCAGAAAVLLVRRCGVLIWHAARPRQFWQLPEARVAGCLHVL